MTTLKQIREETAKASGRNLNLNQQEYDDENLPENEEGSEQKYADQSQNQKKSKEDEEKNASHKMRRMLQFNQYMRVENEKDRELMEEFIKSFEDIEGWEKEDHLDDLRPSIWFRNGNYVAEVYASLGTIAAVFGYLPKEKPRKDDDSDRFNMPKSIFPPVALPYEIEDEDTGEVEESFENAYEKFQEFLEECADYIAQTEGEDEEVKSDARAASKHDQYDGDIKRDDDKETDSD